MIRRPPRSTLDRSSAASDVYKRQLLHYYLLEPFLGIGDPRYDNRIDFIAGFHGLEGIEKKVDSGEAKVGFALFATQMENIINFADKRLTMRPKSTWFDPKPLDGLVAYDFE